MTQSTTAQHAPGTLIARSPTGARIVQITWTERMGRP